MSTSTEQSAAHPPSSSQSRHLVRDVLKLGWPVLVAQFATMLNGVIDTIMAGRHGTVDLAAVGISNAIFFSVFGPLMGITLATTPIVARLYGAKRYGEIGEKIRQGMWLALALSVIALCVFIYPDPLLSFTQASPEVSQLIRAYLGYIALGAPAVMMFRLFTNFSTAVSRPRNVMTLNIIGLAFKVPLNWVFMYGHLGMPEMGAAGCALATTLITWCTCIAGWVIAARSPEYRRYTVFARWSWPDRKALWELVSLGVPMGFTFLVDVTAFTFMALFIARLGAVMSASHQIAANMVAISFMLPVSLGNATGVLVGQAIGANDYVRARATGIAGVGIGLAESLITSTILMLGSSLIASLYSHDPAVRAMASTLIALVALYHLGDSMQAVSVNVLRGYKRTAVPMLIYSFGLWGIGLAGGYWIGLGNPDLSWLGLQTPLGARGFWMGGIAGMFTAGIAVAVYFLYVSDPVRARRAEAL